MSKKVFDESWVTAGPVMKEDRELLFQLADELDIPIYPDTREGLNIHNFPCLTRRFTEGDFYAHIIGRTDNSNMEKDQIIVEYVDLVSSMREELLKRKQND